MIAPWWNNPGGLQYGHPPVCGIDDNVFHDKILLFIYAVLFPAPSKSDRLLAAKAEMPRIRAETTNTAL